MDDEERALREKMEEEKGALRAKQEEEQVRLLHTFVLLYFYIHCMYHRASPLH